MVGKLGTPKLAQILAYGKWLYPYRMQLHGASYLDQRCLKTHNSEDGCSFPPNVFAPTLKITPNSILGIGGPFNAKPIIQRALRKSHVLWSYEGESLQLYRCREVLRGTRYAKIFQLGSVRRRRAP